MIPNIKQPFQSLNEQAHFFWPHIYIHIAIWKRISWNTTLQSSELDLSVKAMVETRLHSKPMLVTWSFWFSSLNWFLPSKKSQYMTKESYSCLPQRQRNQLFYPCHFVGCLEHWVNTARLHSVETSSTTTTLGDGCFCRTISEASLL